jgi:hypothetical protein
VTVVCPNGHQSATTDYCDQCGAKIEGRQAAGAAQAVQPAGAAEPAHAAAAEPEPEATPTGEPCPVCGAARVGTDRYCEGCGYDFTAVPAVGEAALAKPDAVWEAVVTADRTYYQRVAPEAIAFPPHCPARTFVIDGREVRIGRRSASRGIQPEIDLGGAPEDTAISHLHALLVQQSDGSYALVDPGSTNGTTVNDEDTPVAANVPVPLSDGDRIHIGAWTTITLHSRPSP